MPNDDELHWILILKQLKISGLDIEHICSELIRRGFLQQDVDFNGDSVGDSKEILRRYRHIEDDLLFKILSRAPLIHDRLPLPLKRPTKSNYVGHFEKLTSTQVHTNSIYCLRYDQSGSRIITGSDDNLIKILAQGILQTTIRGHLNRNEGFVLDFDVSKDNQVMVTAGSDKTVRCWSLYGDQLSYHHIGKEIINTVISPCGKVLLVSCADGKVRAFGKAITGFEPEGLTLEAGTLNKDEVTSVLFHPSSKRFICGSEDGNIYLYSVKKLAFSRKNELPRNQRDLAAIRESTDGSTVLPSMIFESHRAPITELCFSPDGNRFASVCKGGVICLHAIGVDGFSKFQATINPPNNHIPLNEVQESKLEFSGVTFNSDGSQLVTFAANTIYIWDGYNLERLNTWTFHSSHITILQLNPVYQSQMLTAGTDGKVVVSENGNILFEYQLTEIILSGMFSPCGEQFCVADYKGFVHIFGPPDERYHQVPPQQFFELDFSKVKEDSYGVLWDETTLQLANPSKGEILSMQRVPWPVTKHMKGAALSIVDNNWSVQRDLEAFERSLEFDNMLWEPVDNRSAVIDKRHMKRRRMMMEIEPEQTRQRNDSAFVEVSTVDILSGPVYVPVSSGDEYDEGSEDGADVAMEEDQSVPIGETSEDEDFMPNGDVAVERPKRMREKNYNTRSAGGPADESLTTDEESSSRHSRPRRKKTRFQIVESGDSEIEDLEESRDLESNSTDQPPVQNVSRFAVSPWLYQNTPKPFPYLPQLQDLVIYCRQGHEEFAKLTSEYPMIVDESLPDILLARVIKINYFLANAIEVCSIKLGIFPTLQPADIPDSKLSPLTIELIHKPECEDFLSLWNDFQHSANSHIEIGDTCSAMVLDKEIQGNLIEIKSGPSPWKKYTIQDGTGSKYEVCPWKMCDSGNSFASHLSVQEDQLERMLSVIQDFRSHEHLDPFVDEIDFDSFPNYLDLVAYPICVQLIHTRLQTGFYRSVAQVGFEWDLMCKNVNTFNKRGSLICQLCKNEVAPYKFKLLGKLNLNQGTNPKPKIQPILDQLDDFVEDEDEEDEDKFSAFTDEESDEFADKARDSRLRSRPKKKSTSRKSTRLGAASRKSIKSLDDEFEFMSDSEDQLISAPSRSSRRRNEMKDTQAHNQSKSNSRSKSNTSSANRENGRTKEKVVSSDESHYGEIIENLRAVSRARIEAASSGRKRRIIRMGISNDSDTEESTTQSSPLASSSSEYYSE